MTGKNRKIPAPLRKLKTLVSPLVRWRYEAWAQTRFKTRLPVTVFRGKIRESGLPFCMVYAGIDTAIAAYWANRFLDEGREERKIGDKWVFTLPSWIKKELPKTDILFVEEGPFTKLWRFLRNGFLVPYWVQAEIDASKSVDEMKKKEKQGFNDVLRRIRKFNLTCEWSKDPEVFEEFFHKMHLPFIKTRHEEETLFVNEQRAKKIFETAEVCMIKKDGEWVGGNTFVMDPDRTYIRFIGLKDGDLELMKYGILGATYYFPLQKAHEKGYKVLDIGGSNPVLSDGLTKFKSYLKAEVIPNTYLPKRFLRIIPVKPSKALRESLQKLPFLYHSRYYHPLRALFIGAADITDKEKVRGKLKSTIPGGLKGTNVFISGDWNRDDARWIEEEPGVAGVRSLKTMCLNP